MRTSIEVADIFRAEGPDYRAAQAGHLNLIQLKVMSAIENCRTAALGGHVDACEDCGHQRIAYNSCLMGKFSNGESARVSGQFFVESWLFSSAMARLCTSSCPHKSDLPGATLGLAASS